ncbi:NAD(P)/FAD-dependent oxidoreductase [Streptomyces sp. NPDC015346]|uniref:NAD(P)/FAD-dependent oxidoreductase n=1 Tax=Streptomyces sp. NPDC015346 TaxID=3364954 RepID=UPI0036F7C4F9
MTALTHAVILGGSLAGTLAAAAAARHVDRVTIIERDALPDAPAPRPGVPQARSVHILCSGGVRAAEELLPGITEQWLAHGVQRSDCLSEQLWLAGHQWLPRTPTGQYTLSSSRDLLDYVVRTRVLSEPSITLRTGSHVEGLLGDRCRVTGAVLRDRRTGQTSTLHADLVIDATGRGSRAPHWLTALGLPKVRETTRRWKATYATRSFHAPPSAAAFPLVSLLPDFCAPGPLRAGVLAPVEDGLWHVVLLGGDEDRHDMDDDRFTPFAHRLRHPLIGDLLTGARPAGPVHAVRGLHWRRRHFGPARRWPEGFIVLGDAAATYNPVLAQGMSITARSALALAHGLAGDPRPCSTPEIQRSINRLTQQAWTVGEIIGLLYHNTALPEAGLRLIRHSHERLMNASTTCPAITRAIADVLSSSSPISRIMTPRIALAALYGSRQPLPPEPPLTPQERAMLAAATCRAALPDQANRTTRDRADRLTARETDHGI